MSLALTIMVVLAIVVFLYNLLVMAEGPEYPTPTYPNRISYPEKGEAPGDWPVLEEAE